ncbi:MAG: SpoIIE family protein phosphatase [Parachlamydiales bacterium]|jgi:serine phosphatase RsbU (regulator of sigma subunit)
MNLSQNKIPNIKNFLAYRIFLILFVLITIPLIIYTIALYKAEYNQKTEDIYNSISIFSDGLKKNIDDNLKLKNEISISIENDMSNKNVDINELLKKRVKEFNLIDIVYLSIVNNNLIVQKSSNNSFINKNFAFLKKYLNMNNAFFQDPVLGNENVIFFSKTVFANQKPIGAILISFPKAELFSLPTDVLSNLNIYIIDSFNKILVSNNKDTVYSKNDNDHLIIKNSLDDYKIDLVISLDRSFIKDEHLKSFYYKHTYALSIVFAFLIVLSIFVIKVISKPLNNLLKTMNEIKKGNLRKRYRAHKLGFEMNYLGHFFNEMMDSLLIQQENIDKEKIEKEKYLEQLKIAHEIQLSLLPQKPNIEDLDIAFDANFAKEVGGDFFDFVIKDNKIFFVIADIASKGILACLYAITLRSIIRSFADYLSDLKDIIIETNKTFLKDSKSNFMFATAWFGVLDINTNKLEYANLGHIPAILRKKDGSLINLTTDNFALGIEEIEDVHMGKVTLNKDEYLFLYTDGIIDAIDKNNQFFGQRNLEEFIKNIPNKSSQEAIESLFEKMKRFSKDSFQYDDMAAVLFKILK